MFHMSSHQIVALSNAEATRLTPNGIHSGMDITIQNIDDSDYVYIGAAGVTTSDFGYRLAPNNAIAFELPGYDAIYAISGTNGTEVAIMKTSLES